MLESLIRHCPSMFNKDKLPLVQKLKILENGEFNHLTIILILPSLVGLDFPLICGAQYVGF